MADTKTADDTATDAPSTTREEIWERYTSEFGHEQISESCDSGARESVGFNISLFKEAIAQTSSCQVSDVIEHCDPIFDDDGVLNFKEVMLTFSILSLNSGDLQMRPVHKMRIATTIDVQQRARAMMESIVGVRTESVPLQRERPAGRASGARRAPARGRRIARSAC